MTRWNTYDSQEHSYLITFYLNSCISSLRGWLVWATFDFGLVGTNVSFFGDSALNGNEMKMPSVRPNWTWKTISATRLHFTYPSTFVATSSFLVPTLPSRRLGPIIVIKRCLRRLLDRHRRHVSHFFASARRVCSHYFLPRRPPRGRL